MCGGASSSWMGVRGRSVRALAEGKGCGQCSGQAGGEEAYGVAEAPGLVGARLSTYGVPGSTTVLAAFGYGGRYGRWSGLWRRLRRVAAALWCSPPPRCYQGRPGLATTEPWPGLSRAWGGGGACGGVCACSCVAWCSRPRRGGWGSLTLSPPGESWARTRRLLVD